VKLLLHPRRGRVSLPGGPANGGRGPVS
jgi:hypothetical protein